MSEPTNETPITLEEGLEIFHGLPAGDLARAVWLCRWHVGVTYSGCSKPVIIESLITPRSCHTDMRTFTREAALLVNEKARELMAAHKAKTATKKGRERARAALQAELPTLVGPVLGSLLEFQPRVVMDDLLAGLCMTAENFWSVLPSVWFAYCGDGSIAPPTIHKRGDDRVLIMLTRDQLVRFNQSIESERAREDLAKEAPGGQDQIQDLAGASSVRDVAV